MKLYEPEISNDQHEFVNILTHNRPMYQDTAQTLYKQPQTSLADVVLHKSSNQAPEKAEDPKIPDAVNTYMKSMRTSIKDRILEYMKDPSSYERHKG